MSTRVFSRTTLLLFLFGFTVLSVEAHEGRPIHLELYQQAPGVFELRWRIPPVLTDIDIPEFSLEGCKSTSPYQFQPRLTGVSRFSCALDDKDKLGPSNGIDQRARKRSGKSAFPKAVALHYPLGNPVLSVLLQYRWINGDSNTLLAGPSELHIELPEQLSVWGVIASYTNTGFDHILEGLDHLLFVACLLMITLLGSLPAGGRAVDSSVFSTVAKRASQAVLLAVSGFTLGHSLTLGLLTLGELSVPSRLVETLIALSIMMMALEIARANLNSWTFRHPAWVATAFGLLHGLGFAGALKEIGLPYQQELLALLFFNVGVELGQLLFIVVLTLLLWPSYLRLTRSAGRDKTQEARPFHDLRVLKFVFSRGVGILSTHWLIVRFLEL